MWSRWVVLKWLIGPATTLVFGNTACSRLVCKRQRCKPLLICFPRHPPRSSRPNPRPPPQPLWEPRAPSGSGHGPYPSFRNFQNMGFPAFHVPTTFLLLFKISSLHSSPDAFSLTAEMAIHQDQPMTLYAFNSDTEPEARPASNRRGGYVSQAWWVFSVSILRVPV